MDMDLESYGPPDRTGSQGYQLDEYGDFEPDMHEVERPRGRPERTRPRGGRWNRDDEPNRRVRSRSREREHWDDYEKYDEYDGYDERDRRDRYRDRGRDERYRDRDDRGYQDRDRDRDRVRDRRDRGRNRRRRSTDRYERDDDYHPRDYDYEDSDRHRGSRGCREIPTTLVMVRGLPYSATEDDLASELQQRSLAYKDVKIIKDKQGESRGYGFVEFHDVKEAEKWMYLTEGLISITDRTVHLEYGKPRPAEQDWACSKCGTLNYASRRRTTCFSCGAPKEEAAEDSNNYEDYCNDSYYDEDSLSSSGGGSHKDRDAPSQAPPCNILIMRGLDVNTTEETVRNNIIQVAGIPIYDVRLIKDKISGVSRGFCFIELGSTEDATKLLDIIQEKDPPYTIENKKVIVGFARNTLHPPPNKPKGRSDSKPTRQRNATHAGNTKIANTAIAQAQAAQAQGFYDQQQSPQFAQGTTASQQTTGSQPAQGQYSAASHSQGYDSAAVQATQQQYQQYYQQQGAVQQGGQMQPQQGQMFHQMYDISSFTYDRNTGYYYDPNSSLYYDVNTGYHYNGTTGQFLYWEPNQQQYYIVNQDGSLSAPASGGVGVTGTGLDNGVDPNKDKDKVPHKPSGASARKIAKDMERWAKKMNEATAIKQTAVKQAMMELKAQELREEALRKQMEDEGVFKKPQLPTLAAAPVTKKVKSLFTPDEEGESPLLGSLQKPKKQSLVAEYEGDDSDDEAEWDSKFIDLSKLACLLCQRKFGNRETLLKHQQMSDLHKQNLEKFKKGQKT